MDAGQARDNLRDVNRVLRGAGMRPFLAFGTLLGHVRDHGLIPHDHDVDVGVFIEEWSRDATAGLQAHGFHCRYQFGDEDCGLELTFARGDVRVDVMFFYRDVEANETWSAVWGERDGSSRRMIKNVYAPFELVATRFLDEQWYIPEKPEEFLASHYGPNWRTPIKDWNWRCDPVNHVLTDVVRPWLQSPFGPPPG